MGRDAFSFAFFMVALASSVHVTAAALCDPCGASASYSDAITTVGSLKKRTITTNGCPNHYNFCFNNASIAECPVHKGGSLGLSYARAQSIDIPASPVIAASTTSVECELGAIGTALNGVGIFSGAVNANCGKLDVASWAAEWKSFDLCSGHSQGGTGVYHYHFPPSCLLAEAEAASSSNPGVSVGHSPQVGWAADGFPIYGPKGAGGIKMLNNPSCSGSHCCDSCGGRQEALADLDSFLYRYYLTGDTSDLISLPATPRPAALDYPFTIRCYVGCTWEALSAGTCSGSTGVSGTHTASPLPGFSKQFSAYPPGSPGITQCKIEETIVEIPWLMIGGGGVALIALILCGLYRERLSNFIRSHHFCLKESRVVFDKDGFETAKVNYLLQIAIAEESLQADMASNVLWLSVEDISGVRVEVAATWQDTVSVLCGCLELPETADITDKEDRKLVHSTTLKAAGVQGKATLHTSIAFREGVVGSVVESPNHPKNILQQMKATTPPRSEDFKTNTKVFHCIAYRPEALDADSFNELEDQSSDDKPPAEDPKPVVVEIGSVGSGMAPGAAAGAV